MSLGWFLIFLRVEHLCPRFRFFGSSSWDGNRCLLDICLFSVFKMADVGSADQHILHTALKFFAQLVFDSFIFLALFE
jgi:hypothetical protein